MSPNTALRTITGCLLMLNIFTVRAVCFRLRNIIRSSPSSYCWNVFAETILAVVCLKRSYFLGLSRGLSLITSTTSNSTPARLRTKLALDTHCPSFTVELLTPSTTPSQLMAYLESNQHSLQTKNSSCHENLE